MSTSVMQFAKSTNAIESGFIAAGLTISIIAAVESVVIVLSWIAFGI